MFRLCCHFRLCHFLSRCADRQSSIGRDHLSISSSTVSFASFRSPASVVYLTDDDRLGTANSFIRLYCALKAASIKFTDDESTALVTLLTSRPSASALGTKFISLSLSMIIACPGLFSNPEDDRRASAWLQWLTSEAPRFESGGGGGVGGGGSGGGFGEMLLLIAIHFHGNQMTAISDLVCATLGMKVPVRSNSLVRLKTIFTQEIFSERVVTSLAVSVPMTKGLSAAIPGFLSVHCIHQLLKSRAFAKHKVPIKDWICRQLKECRGPLHPVVPPLVEAFVNSTLIPSRQAAQNTNEPLSQQVGLDLLLIRMMRKHSFVIVAMLQARSVSQIYYAFHFLYCSEFV